MSTATRSRWIAWKPKARILADSAENEPTKPTKPSSEGFEGATSAESPEIGAVPDAAAARAISLLNRSGVRIMALEGGPIIGIWSDLDGPSIRAALRTLGMAGVPIRYLDLVSVPARFKLRRAQGEPVPTNIRMEMELQREQPWRIRDRMLRKIGWCGTSFAR